MNINQLPPPPHYGAFLKGNKNSVAKQFSNSFAQSKKICLIMCCALFSTALFAGGPKWSVAGNNVNNNDFLGTTNNQALVFKTNNVEALRILPGGYVGIGLSNPTTTLDVNGGFHLYGNATLDSNLTVSRNLFLPLQAQATFSLLSIDNTGQVLPFTFSGNANEVLLGNGTFGTVSSLAGWAINGNNVYTTLSGNVGIGTSTPTAKLDVIGNAIITGGVLTTQVTISSKINSDTVVSGIINTDTATIGRIHVGGGLAGIEPLTVNGNARISGTLFSGGLHVTGQSYFDSIKTEKLQIGDSSLILSSSTVNNSVQNNIYVDPTNPCTNHTLYLQSAPDIFTATTPGEPRNYNVVMCQDQIGNVGIGTADPTAQLHIRSTYCPSCLGSIPSSPCGGNPPPSSLTAIVRLQDDEVNTGGTVLGTEMWDVASSVHYHRFYVSRDISSGYTGQQYVTSRPYFSMNDLGNFGIGTFDAQAKLEVIGFGKFTSINNNADYIRIGNDGSNSSIDAFGAGKLLINYNSGNEIDMGTGNTKADVYMGKDLYVCGKIKTSKVEVRPAWCDFVFQKQYKLMPLAQLDTYVKNNHHLPDIPSEKMVKENGIEVGNMVSKLLQKVEELTLYTIQQQKEIDELQKANKKLQKKFEK